jgi:poly-beta-1,6-N-acetyl-D-glucosamine biosynthesis protein PgaD
MNESVEHQPPRTRYMAEIALTVIFWGAWIYFILPLISLILWYAGISLFVEEMFVRGGIEAFIEKLRTYGLVVFLMMLGLMFWTQWNFRRYGGVRNARTIPRPDVALIETAQAAGLEESMLDRLQRSQRIVVDYDEQDRMQVLIAEEAVPRAPKRKRSRRRKPPV